MFSKILPLFSILVNKDFYTLLYNFGNYTHHIIGDSMKMKKACLYVFLFAIILLNLTIIHATNQNNYNINSFFRIHVVANSDSIDDQLLKLKVAKQVDEYIRVIVPENISKDEAKKVISNNIYNILEICENTINENNKDYSVKAYIGNIKYDYKTYNDHKFNPGIYDSLKIVLGQGKGNNWWSLIYPGSIDLDEYLDSNETCSFMLLDIIRNIFKK